MQRLVNACTLVGIMSQSGICVLELSAGNYVFGAVWGVSAAVTSVMVWVQMLSASVRGDA